ncbi:MAG: hypothetical protein ACRDKU_04875, partial [Gaiellaceae bacterium]
MSITERLERCHECGEPVEVYASTCAACGASLVEAKLTLFRELRDTGAMTDEAFEAAVDVLREGPLEAPEVRGGTERKQLTDLTLADLARCPVWEFAIDEEGEPGQDEETLRPRGGPSPVDPSDGLFLVAARLTTADGTQLGGYVMTSDARDEAHSPTVLTEAGETVPFWYGIVKPSRTNLEDAYRTLGKDASELFPIRVEALVPTTSGPLVSEINGFGYYDKWPDVRVLT